MVNFLKLVKEVTNLILAVTALLTVYGLCDIFGVW